MTDKSPRPMSSARSPRGGKSLTVKVCNARNTKSEELLVRLRYGSEARQTKTSKKGQWDEDTTFNYDESIKTLGVELLKSGMLGKKKSLGETTVTIADLAPGISSTWFAIKSSKGKDKGEIQLTIDVPKPEKKKISLKETEELLAATGLSNTTPDLGKKVEDLDINKAFESLGLNQARAYAQLSNEAVDVVLDLTSIGIDKGSLVFSFANKDDSSITLQVKVPKGAQLDHEFKQSPVTRSHFVHPKLQLQPSFATHVQTKSGTSGEAPYFGAIINARAVSHELKNSKRIKAAFKVDLVQVAQTLSSDELGDIEKTPETVQGELIHAAFRGATDVVQKCLERGDDVNEGDENQETALHKAVSRGIEELIKLLVDAGADPRQQNKWGQSPTDIATKFRPELVTLLHSYQ